MFVTRERLYAHPVVRVIKSKRMGRGACSAYGGKERLIQGLVGKPK